MKNGSTVFAVAMAMMVMSGSFLWSTQAQTPTADCLTVAGAGASFDDASTVVSQLLTMPGQCCQSNSAGFCSVLTTSMSAAATVCGSYNFCPNCVDVGNGLNQVLAQCNQLNTVQGVYSPDGTSSTLFYLTSASNHP